MKKGRRKASFFIVHLRMGYMLPAIPTEEHFSRGSLSFLLPIVEAPSSSVESGKSGWLAPDLRGLEQGRDLRG